MVSTTADDKYTLGCAFVTFYSILVQVLIVGQNSGDTNKYVYILEHDFLVIKKWESGLTWIHAKHVRAS